MLLSLSSVALLLLSLRGAPVDAVAAPPLTYTDVDPVSGASLECDRCPPGTYLRSRCTSTRKSDCAPCPSGSFTELWNYIGKCLRCSLCDRDQVVKKACTADSDCQCECKPGYYYRRNYGMCLRHSECPVGQGVLSNGTADQDTVCEVCANGTFSDAASPRLGCAPHRSCDAAGQRLLLSGTSWHDSVCTSCRPQDTDGADYLRDILPVFFLQQKIPTKRLRQIVHSLKPENGERRGRRAAGLHERIHAWVASATAGQIRQMPELLRRAGVRAAGARLEAKLRRIDAQLSEQCSLTNEVDRDVGPRRCGGHLTGPASRRLHALC